MKKLIIIVIVVIVLAAAGLGLYFLFSPRSASTGGSPANAGSGGALPGVSTQTTPGQISSSAPTGAYFMIGTAKGAVQVKNFYLSNPPVGDDGILIIKQTANYAISYNPLNSSFWMEISSGDFLTSQSIAEKDLLATLGVSQADACKLAVTSGVIYSPGNPNDGKAFPLSFCPNSNSGVFQAK